MHLADQRGGDDDLETVAVPELPMGATGKILKDALRARAGADLADS